MDLATFNQSFLETMPDGGGGLTGLQALYAGVPFLFSPSPASFGGGGLPATTLGDYGWDQALRDCATNDPLLAPPVGMLALKTFTQNFAANVEVVVQGFRDRLAQLNLPSPWAAAPPTCRDS